VKLVDISGLKRGTYSEGKIIELKKWYKHRDIRELCRGVN